MKKFTIDFIEEPDVFDVKEMSQIYGGGGGLCIGFHTKKNCGCYNVSKNTAYSSEDEKESEKTYNGDDKEKCDRKLVGRYNDKLCIIVTLY